VNTQEYIASGIVESYVLGLASADERLAFEQACEQYPAVRQARDSFEQALEEQALAAAVTPPAFTKEKIMAAVNATAQTVAFGNEDLRKETAKEYSLSPQASRLGSLRWLAAASVILLLGSTALNFLLYNKYRAASGQLDEMLASNQQMASANKVMQTRLDEYTQSINHLKDSNMAVIAMKGQAIAPQSLSTVYWDRQTKDVFLLVNALPMPAEGKQYQLWAIVDNKPVDAGLLDMSQANALVKMKNIPRAQAFAITLEKKGGSAVPDLKALYVMGKV